MTDLVRWLTALRSGDALSRDSYRLISRPVELPDKSTAPYGLGLQIRDEAGQRTIGHSGLINGFASTVRYFPEGDVTIALLMNTAPPEPPQQLWDEIVRAVFAQDVPTTTGVKR